VNDGAWAAAPGEFEVLCREGQIDGTGRMSREQTISPAYLKLQQDLHKNPNYGVASIAYAPMVKRILETTRAASLSDYGAGKQNLKKALADLGKSDFDYRPYDPAFPDYGPPQPGNVNCSVSAGRGY
jgi:hypothetical protein